MAADAQVISTVPMPVAAPATADMSSLRLATAQTILLSETIDFPQYIGKRFVTHNPLEVIMHIQVVNFNLEGISRTKYETVCNELAEASAALPELVSKQWLADEKNNTYGGVCI